MYVIVNKDKEETYYYDDYCMGLRELSEICHKNMNSTLVMLREYNGDIISDFLIKSKKEIELSKVIKMYFELKGIDLVVNEMFFLGLATNRKCARINVNNKNISQALLSGIITMEEYKMLKDFIYKRYSILFELYLQFDTFDKATIYFESIKDYNKFKKYLKEEYNIKITRKKLDVCDKRVYKIYK